MDTRVHHHQYRGEDEHLLCPGARGATRLTGCLREKTALWEHEALVDKLVRLHAPREAVSLVAFGHTPPMSWYLY